MVGTWSRPKKAPQDFYPKFFLVREKTKQRSDRIASCAIFSSNEIFAQCINFMTRREAWFLDGSLLSLELICGGSKRSAKSLQSMVGWMGAPAWIQTAAWAANPAGHTSGSIVFFFAFSWAKARTPSFSGKSSSTSKVPEKTWGTDFFGYRFVWEKTRFTSRTPSFFSGFSCFYRVVKHRKTWGAENLWVPMSLAKNGASIWRPTFYHAKFSA